MNFKKIIFSIFIISFITIISFLAEKESLYAAVVDIDATNITSGVVAHERGGLEADVSAFDNSVIKIDSGSTSAIPITSFGESLIGQTDASNARSFFGLEIGSNVQAYSSNLSTAANLGTYKLMLTDGSGNNYSFAFGAEGTGLCFHGISSIPTACTLTGAPGGSSTQVQINNNGSFIGYPWFVATAADNTVTIQNLIVSGIFTIAASSDGPGEYWFWDDTDLSSYRMILKGPSGLADNNSVATLHEGIYTIIGDSTTDTFTNKTYSYSGTGNNLTLPYHLPVSLETPGDSDDIIIDYAKVAITISSVTCIANGTTPSVAVNIHECDQDGASNCATILSGDITCNGGLDTGTVTDTSIAVDHTLKLIINGTPSGNVTGVTIFIDGSQTW